MLQRKWSVVNKNLDSVTLSGYIGNTKSKTSCFDLLLVIRGL
jgi:hypothetical protein